MDCNPLSSSVYGILQARILEWDAILFSYMHTYIHKYMWKSESEVTQSCPTLCDLVDYSLPGSSVHVILQARILEWLPFPSPEDLADPGVKPGSSALEADTLTSEPPGMYVNFFKVSLCVSSQYF